MGENYFGITDPGRQRTNNEDRFIAQTVFSGQHILACVIDGVGGYAGGEVAAELTRDEIISQLDSLPSNISGHMVAALQNANERIIKEKEVSPQNEKMACVVTMAIVDIEKNLFYYAHVGDTRLYLFRDGSLIKVTKDHSTVGFLEESGRLTEEAAMQHPKRNEVNKALGYETQTVLTKDFIDSGESPFLPGDTILLCSDGLTDLVPAGKIISVLESQSTLVEKGATLVDAANAAGGKDNITVVLVHNDKSPLQHPATKPLVAVKKNNSDNVNEVTLARPEINHGAEPVKKNSGKKINELILLFGIISFAGFAWLLYKNYMADKPVKETVIQPVPNKQRNQQELNFLDSLHKSPNAVIKLSSSQPIIISDTIFVQNDSLHIIGNGVSFVRDSSYTGPAFMLAPNCKYILLDSVSIENFNVGVAVQNKGLHLRNVRFKNCTVPVQFQQQFLKDTLVTGSQAETIFNYKDSGINLKK